MNLPSHSLVTSSERRVLLIAGAWATAAWLSRFIGPWYGIGGAAIVLGFVCVAGDSIDLRLRLQPRPVLAALGSVGAVAMLGSTYGLYPILKAAIPSLGPEVNRLYRIFGAPSSLGAMLLTAVILGAIVLGEEIVWRGAVQTAQEPLTNRAAAVAATSLIYGAVHLPLGSPLLALLALVCGLFWSSLRAWTGSLVPGLICHLTWDLFVLILLPLEHPR